MTDIRSRTGPRTRTVPPPGHHEPKPQEQVEFPVRPAGLPVGPADPVEPTEEKLPAEPAEPGGDSGAS